jgi:hypothetical protein
MAVIQMDTNFNIELKALFCPPEWSITWYLSNAIAVILIVETNIEVASSANTSLHVVTPNGQDLTEISTNENGIVKKQRRRSEMAKLMINRLRDVRILGFRATTTQTSPLPIVPININIVYAITNAIRLILSRALLLIYRSNFSIIFEISASSIPE